AGIEPEGIAVADPGRPVAHGVPRGGLDVRLWTAHGLADAPAERGERIVCNHGKARLPAHRIGAGRRLPELPRRPARALGHAGELRPGNVRVDGRLADPGAEAAIRPGDDVLAADQPRVAADALGHQVRVLDEVGR